MVEAATVGHGLPGCPSRLRHRWLIHPPAEAIDGRTLSNLQARNLAHKEKEKEEEQQKGVREISFQRVAWFDSGYAQVFGEIPGSFYVKMDLGFWGRFSRKSGHFTSPRVWQLVGRCSSRPRMFCGSSEQHFPNFAM